jgi:hypothetical protein
MREESISRRRLLRRMAAIASIVPMAAVVRAADTPLIRVDDPAAKAVKYVEDASKAKEAVPHSNCANCALYLGKSGATLGPCQILPGKSVLAAGWCNKWAPQI